MKQSSKPFSLHPLSRRILHLGLLLCLIHGIFLLASATIGYYNRSLLHFLHNVAGLKAMLLSLSLTFFGTGLCEKIKKSE